MNHLRRILMAEDDDRDVELALLALAKHNLANRVDVVHDGAEALDYLYRRGDYKDRPDADPVVVLLDLKMPKVGGLDVLRRMKNDERLRTIPVVIVTSSKEERDVIDCYRHHVNAYVVKPVDFQQLIDAVRTLGLFWAVVNETPNSFAAKERMVSETT